MCIIIAGHYGGLRGEEIAKGDQGLTAKQFDHAVKRREDPFVPLTMLGRFKQKTGRKTFIQPLAAIADDSRNLSRWFSMLMTYQTSFEEPCTGPLFKNEKGKRMGIAEMDVLFHGMLREVRKRDPSIIHDDVSSEARNARLPTDIINAHN